ISYRTSVSDRFLYPPASIFFFFNNPATTEIYTLSLHDALPISTSCFTAVDYVGMPEARIILAQTATYLASAPKSNASYAAIEERSEEHTSELESRGHLVCRLLLEKKKTNSIRRQRLYAQRYQPC